MVYIQPFSYVTKTINLKPKLHNNCNKLSVIPL